MDQDQDRDQSASAAPEVSRAGFIAVVGDTNAGKSTLVNALVGDKISIVAPKPQTTRRSIRAVKTTAQTQFIYIDAPGFIRAAARNELNRALEREARSAMAGVDVLLLVLDAASLKRAPQRLRALRGLLREGGAAAPQVVAINKIDLLSKEDLLPLIQEVSAVFGEDGAAPAIVPISARKRDGLDVLEREIEKHLPEGAALVPADTLTDLSERELVAERVREKATFYLEQEIPYNLAVVVEEWNESDAGLDIGAVIYVARAGHKKIVIGKQGGMIKKIGIAARRELEEFFGTHINLRLFVSVKEKWTESAAGLRRVGIE